MANHIHKFGLFKLGYKNNYKTYKCFIPGCPTFLPVPTMLVGRPSVCWYCDVTFNCDRRSARLSKPHCGCQYKNYVKDPVVDELITKLFQ